MESEGEEDAMVVGEVPLALNEDPEEGGDDEEEADALGDEQEELSLVRRLQQSRGLLARGGQQHHPSLDQDTEDDEHEGGASPRAAATAGVSAFHAASASASARTGGSGSSSGSGSNGRVGPSEAVRAALHAVRDEAPAVKLVPLLAAAREELEEYLFRCPVPHKVRRGRRRKGGSAMDGPSHHAPCTMHHALT
jgi:hypothetical protein